MKRIIVLTIILFAGISSLVYSQDETGGDRRMRPPLEKIEQLEKAKLIEILDLKEETAVRFFARRKEYRNEQHDIFEQRDKMVKNIEKKLKDGDTPNEKECKEKLNEIIALDLKLVQQKEKFFNSLNDLLTPQQILKLAVFDNRFMREIRELLAGRRKGKAD